MSKALEQIDRLKTLVEASLTEQLSEARDRLIEVVAMRGEGEVDLAVHNELIRQAQVKLSNARSFMAQSRGLKDVEKRVKHAERDDQSE